MTENLYAATFVRGMRYIIAKRGVSGGDLEITRGDTVIITEELRDHLEEDAVDDVAGELDEETGEREILRKGKFEFVEYDGDLPAGSVVSNAPAPARRRVTKTKRAA